MRVPPLSRHSLNSEAGGREPMSSAMGARAGPGLLRTAAVLAWFAGLYFGLPCTYAIWYLADHGAVWTFLGFPTYGSGPFEDIGIQTTVPLLVLFLLVCAAELTAGWLLWRRRRAGAALALALLPVEFAFWIGFALPLGPPAGLARTALILLGWSSLTRRRALPRASPKP